MSQRLASPTAVELVYGAIEAAPFPEQPKVVVRSKIRDVALVNHVFIPFFSAPTSQDLVAGDCCVKNNNLPVAAPHPTTSHHSTHTGATPDAHQTTPEELAAAALLSVPPRSSPVKKTDAPSTGGTRSSSDKKPDSSSAGGNEAAGALAAPAAAGDSYIALHASQKQRTNWGQWPLGTFYHLSFVCGPSFLCIAAKRENRSTLGERHPAHFSLLPPLPTQHRHR